ncbi:hypothetical protein MLD38_025662 [Melastoma candidum]|uniref:Uncharacterized protein n=1 Tax=Melastoma candidum TaxID=119954 RepID=A0ACB9NZ75_9MYRT|nr:hypothetical protein MLD38_025662 [Melastoma candidum]
MRRGYWRTPKDVPKDGLPNWFEKEIMTTGLSDPGETLYFPQRVDFGWDFLPKGTRSLLVQPLLKDSDDDDMQMTGEKKGFLILAS